MSILNLHHLRLFRAVAHDGALTAAAKRLNLSPSALSSQLRTLEAALGHDLFERRGRGLVLTEAGRIALDHADAIFRTAEDLSATLRESGRARRILRVGALATLSRNFQLQFLAPALRRPDVEVTLRSGGQTDLLAGLESLALDVVLTNLAPARDASKRFLAHRQAEQDVHLVGAAEFATPGAPLREHLARAPLVLPTPETSIRAAFDGLVSRLGITPNIAAEVDDMAMMRLLAREGVGLAVIPPIVARDELASGRLIDAGPLPGISETFLAVTLERRFPNPLLADLLAGEDARSA
ncbi:MAG: LysR family transcriptional regulator [Salinarimonadaceae bacterium]|nr:MAG: LysR family transcriptional regulator [Salinarimonadaceae bacterium]